MSGKITVRITREEEGKATEEVCYVLDFSNDPSLTETKPIHVLETKGKDHG